MYQVQTIYKQKIEKEEILSMNYDQGADRVIFLVKELSEDDFSQKKVYRFKIFGIDQQRIIFQTQINFEPLIGKLNSGLFTFVDGHIYYNNNVIKIRYDLIDREIESGLIEGGESKYKENEIFDYYFDIFDLEP